jgi:hypothetical protein
MEHHEVLQTLNFGRVDAETDSKFDSCFIGTEMLRQVLQPQHSLILGSKGSGKSAAFRLLCDDREKIKHLMPKGYEAIIAVPAYGMQNEEYLPGLEFNELKFSTVDDFRYFWMLYIGLKTVSTLAQDEKVATLVEASKNPKVKAAYKTIQNVMDELGLAPEPSTFSKFKLRFRQVVRPLLRSDVVQADEMNRLLSADFRHRTGMSVKALLDNVDTILTETNCLAWVMLDKLDLLFIDDFEKLKAAITGLVQILVEHSNRFQNIHFKIFLRNDIYRQLRIVNKSHLISYTSEMKWREGLLLKLLVSRAIADPVVKEYCEQVAGEPIEVADVIGGTDAYVQKIFYTIFESTLSQTPSPADDAVPFTHVWIMRHLTDGAGNIYPREVIHLGNMAVEKQRELDRIEGKHGSARLITARALKEAFASVSVYRCDTYLYSEFPHLGKHFDHFRGSQKATFTRDELDKLFERLTPNGDEAIRAIYDAGLITPLGRTVDSSLEFKVPLLYRIGLGITQRGAKLHAIPKHMTQEYHDPMVEEFAS